MDTWGIWDTKDNLWLGDDDGPNLYQNETIKGLSITGEKLAIIAAQIASEMLSDDPLRVQPKIYNEEAVRKEDEIIARMNGAEAIKRLEEGEI